MFVNDQNEGYRSLEHVAGLLQIAVTPRVGDR